MAEKKGGKKKTKAYRQLKSCPKCGVGMGEHADRYACGGCGYTEFKMQNKQHEKR